MDKEKANEISLNLLKKEHPVLLINYSDQELTELIEETPFGKIYLFDFATSLTLIQLFSNATDEASLSYLLDELLDSGIYLNKEKDIKADGTLIVFKSIERFFFSLKEKGDGVKFLKTLSAIKKQSILLSGFSTFPFLDSIAPLIDDGKILVYRKGQFGFSDYLKKSEGKEFLVRARKDKRSQSKIRNSFYHYLFNGEQLPSNEATSLNESKRIIDELLFNNIKGLQNGYSSQKDKEIIRSIYLAIPRELLDVNRRFQKSHLKIKDAKNLDLAPYFERLKESGYAIVVSNVKSLGTPLEYQKQIDESKVYYPDIAYTYHTALSKEKKLLARNDIILCGGLYENAVAIELSKNSNHELYYYSDKKQGRIDFVFEQNGLLYFVMVEAGKTKKEIKQNRLLLARLLKANPKIGNVLILTKDSFKKIDSKAIEIPIYMLFELN